MELSINFNSKYKGKIKDKIGVKLSALLLFIIVGLVFIFVGFYLYFVDVNRVITRMDRFEGFIFMCLGLLLIALSPLSIIFKHFNKGLIGDIYVLLYQNNDSNKWMYRVSSTKKSGPFLDMGEINLLLIKKNIAIIKTIKGEEYIIPLKVLDISQKEALFGIEKEVKNERIRQTNNK